MSAELGMRILVLEDDGFSRKLLRSLLESEGHEVIAASNGVEGMRAMRKQGADVVITDLFMPEQDGFVTLAQLRREYPSVPVIAVTAGSPAMSLENAQATSQLMGASAFLTKPLDMGQLRDALGSMQLS